MEKREASILIGSLPFSIYQLYTGGVLDREKPPFCTREFAFSL
jgi:hypothetical protein